MAIIKQLAPEEIHKIAAGEVVERPANVVKELVENALDAGAKNITLYVEHGGKALIRLVDDGCGMAPEDLRMCVVHHATSKMNSVDELSTIQTFGFRGEALSSIASVSRVSIISKTSDVLEGTKISLEEGTIVSEVPTAATDGTDIVITDLFYNVPARKKFLKKDETEWRAISQLIQAYALANLAHSFKVYHNNRLFFHAVPTDDIKERLRVVLGDSYAQALCVAAPEKHTGFALSGVITNPHFKRYDRSNIFLFVNNRWVKNSKLISAFIKGYGGVLPSGRFPAGVVHITADAGEIDVNIHPRKEEVQFLHPRRVALALERMVSKALAENTTGMFTSPTAPTTSSGVFEKRAFVHSDTSDVEVQAHHNTDAERITNALERMRMPQADVSGDGFPSSHTSHAGDPALQSGATTLSESDVGGASQVGSGESMIVAASPLAESQTVQESLLQHEVVREADVQYAIVGQFARTYIMVEQKDGLLLVDQHAAHERFLYEMFAKRFADVAVVPFLFPPLFSLAPAEADLLDEYADLFGEHGIEVSEMGERQYAVKAVPVMLKNKDVIDMVKSALASFSSIKSADKAVLQKELHHALRAQMACKAAVKAGDVLTRTQMQELITNLNAVDNRFSCPHGRPTTWHVPLNEIERRFKRKI